MKDQGHKVIRVCTHCGTRHTGSLRLCAACRSLHVCANCGRDIREGFALPDPAGDKSRRVCPECALEATPLHGRISAKTYNAYR